MCELLEELTIVQTVTLTHALTYLWILRERRREILEIDSTTVINKQPDSKKFCSLGVFPHY